VIDGKSKNSLQKIQKNDKNLITFAEKKVSSSRAAASEPRTLGDGAWLLRIACGGSYRYPNGHIGTGDYA